MDKTRQRLARLAVLILLPLLLSGCRSTEMKGTPFYSGEYSVRRGPAEDRVNLWPLLYYREPALSVLWPIGEFTEDHFAIRPLLSVYGLDQSNRVYNVLWPLAQFDRQTGDNRIFPLFWGRDYAVAFPLYWHFDHPFGPQGGYDALFPLWSFYREPGRYNAHIVWPFLNFKDIDRVKGWRVWPLAGNYAHENGDFYRFALWPLGHQWREDAGKDTGTAFLPLFFQNTTPKAQRFFSLPYSSSEATDGSAWQLAPPFFFHSSDTSASRLITPLYSRGENLTRHENWSLLFPLYYSTESDKARTVATLLGGYRRNEDGHGWIAAPLLSGGWIGDGEGDYWFGGPLAHVGWDKTSSSSHVFPLYYRSQDDAGSLFLSLPWSRGNSADGTSWQLIPPLFFRIADRNSSAYCVFPLYYVNDRNGAFVSLLAARWQNDDGKEVTAVPPALSFLASDKDRSDLWLLGGIGHFSWGEKAESQHVLPLYYANRRTGTFASPLGARWRSGDDTTTYLFPPALSWMTKAPKASDLWIAGPLAHFSWGEEASASHLFPLYYASKDKETFLSPLVAKWQSGNTEHWVYPPLLSEYVSDGEKKGIHGLLGLISDEWSPEERKGHFIPFYFYGTKPYHELYTPVFGWSRDPSQGFVYPLTPLFGWFTGDYSGGWLFPLYSHERNKKTGDFRDTFLWGEYVNDNTHSEAWLFPFFGYRIQRPPPESTNAVRYARYGKTFWSLPACWYENEVLVTPVRHRETQAPDTTNTVTRTYVKKHGFFPLWRYSSERNPDKKTQDVYASMLLLLYDYTHTVTPAQDNSGVDDYSRSRVLWRLWHSERSNGNVSVDVFPAITYDRKTDGFKKISFLWRLFRYERSKDGSKLDLLFIPLKR